jgi:hypothetical protein
LLGALKIAKGGPQNHHFTAESLKLAYREAFGGDLPLA